MLLHHHTIMHKAILKFMGPGQALVLSATHVDRLSYNLSYSSLLQSVAVHKSECRQLLMPALGLHLWHQDSIILKFCILPLIMSLAGACTDGMHLS